MSSFSDYVNAWNSSATTSQIVYLATDDAQVAYKEVLTVVGHIFKYNKHAIESLGSLNITASASYFQRAEAAGGHLAFFLDTYADIDILIRCHTFIGMRNSGMSQIVATMKSFQDSGDIMLL